MKNNERKSISSVLSMTIFAYAECEESKPKICVENGEDVERIHLQKKDVEYEVCLVRKGFSIKQLYWISSPYKNVR